MYVKEITLEGFKSYATQTVVSGFDPYFNAITGLNGSGKSNILDSICFVLGITNLQQVRASNLQELVYKQGQAGITKATVSVTFDNSDRSRSPLGYESSQEITVTRTIVVGGRNKYLINGRLAQPSSVQTLFHSVQLNVNNPHFLIMQGRITKVLNMKPPEILSMLEEAAGTRMYETKKEAALKTLEKKQAKVDEMDKLLDHDILPALEKLRKERMQYMQWSNGNAELDRLRRFCIAYEYVQAEKVRDSAVGGVGEIKAKIADIDGSTERMQVEIQEMEGRISILTAEREAKLGGEMKALSERVDALSRDLVKETTILTNQEESLKTEKTSAEKIVRSIEDVKNSIKERDSTVKKTENGAADLKNRAEDLSKNLEKCEKEYQGVLAGKGSENDEKYLEDQLSDARAAVGNAEAELKQLEMKINHCEKELKEKKERLASKRKEAVAVENELNAKMKDVENIRQALQSTPYEEGQMEALQKDRTTELEVVQKLKDEVRMLSAQLANVEFNYRDPVKSFDRAKVKGVVAKLIKVKDRSNAIALEVAAGGKLYNVVVDTEETGKQLLKNGDLRRRVTIIPLNKIHSQTIPRGVQNAATRLVGEDNAEIALNLVDYNEDIKNAMAYVFGSTFVCKTSEAAKTVAFNRDVKTTSVTLEGDIFQPSGLLTGGVENFSTSASQEKYNDLKSQLELKTYDLSLFQSRAEQNEHHKVHENERERLVMEKEAVVQELASLENQLALSKTQINSLTLEIDGLKSKVCSVKMEYDQAESELNLSRSKLKECDSQISNIFKEQQRLQHQISDQNVEKKKLENEVKRVEMEQKDCSLKVDKLLEKHSWIAAEKQLFGKSGTDYDFSSRDTQKSREAFEKLQAEQAGDFGSIFSTLLPGTMAKLEPPEGCSFLDGLEVRVAFGSVWKQSLSELSGGQRSLLALSLILALLLFKPAPLYILDEVDAALDLSHTQNIGRMIKSHFPHSQFIVVSLKEGMFNNANVIFRTKFVDGVSTVQRTVTSKHSK
ncbi:Structural maintenance of chromosomes protein 2-2 [Acorus calamus]|uniref:Structural maintenance of chromosomes protein 2-2 n=1 Tax=Acorus calamus TaxID=4465 RepID=A0AAV9C7W8_ACOCL|nr:Structural maintenance of chromosomes protein 2-2 [Acorus calamus]